MGLVSLSNQDWQRIAREISTVTTESAIGVNFWVTIPNHVQHVAKHRAACAVRPE
jgi:hypothetical protein